MAVAPLNCMDDSQDRADHQRLANRRMTPPKYSAWVSEWLTGSMETMLRKGPGDCL